MRKFIFVTLLVLASSSANAQTRTTTGGTSNTGANSAAGTGNTGFGSTNTQFGQAFNFSNNGINATGITSPFGNANSAGRTGGMMGMGGMGGMGMMGMGGMGMGGMGMGGMGMGGMGMGGMGGRGQQQNGRGGMGGAGQQQYTLRPTVKLGFDVPMPNSQARGQQIQLTMARLPQANRFAGANVAVEGRKAIVTGNVDKGQRELLKRLLLLEPGIYEVDMSRLDGATAGDSSSSRPNRQDAEAVTPAETVPPPKQ